jgi:hypothetical protein
VKLELFLFHLKSEVVGITVLARMQRPHKELKKRSWRTAAGPPCSDTRKEESSREGNVHVA